MTMLRRLLSPRRLIVVGVVAVLVVSGVLVLQDRSHTSISAYFTNTTGLYVGDQVRVVGVDVGKVTRITPEGTRVRVELQVSASQPIPKDAKAAIVAPTLVSGRYVQLAPAWRSGPRLGDGAVIGLDRTTIPVSFDEVKKELTALSSALGPAPGKQKGSLSRAIDVLDANLRSGDGEQLRRSIRSLRAAAGTLSDGSSNLFTTVRNLNAFTRNLAINDGAVRGFTNELDQVSRVLDANRTELTAAVGSLSATFRTTRGFLEHNRGVIKDSTRQLNTLTAILADRSNELAGVLHIAPTALNNLSNIIDDRAITARAALVNFDSVSQLVCGAILGVGGTAAQCRSALQPLLTLLGLDQASQLGGSHGIPGASGAAGGQPSTSLPGALGGLLGGLLGGSAGTMDPAGAGLLGLGNLLGGS